VFSQKTEKPILFVEQQVDEITTIGSLEAGLVSEYSNDFNKPST
jgi:hypothetical protein